MQSDQESKEKFKVSVDENDIINLVFLIAETNPEASAVLAKSVEQEIGKILETNPQKIYRGIVDFSFLEGKVSYVASDIRKVYSRLIFHKQIEKIAMVGSNMFYKAVVNLIVEVVGKGENVKWFSNKEEAIKWLKEKE